MEACFLINSQLLEIKSELYYKLAIERKMVRIVRQNKPSKTFFFFFYSLAKCYIFSKDFAIILLIFDVRPTWKLPRTLQQVRSVDPCITFTI